MTRSGHQAAGLHQRNLWHINTGSVGHRMAPHAGSPARPERPGALPHVGRAISHESPSARQSKRISPFSWPRIMLSITRVPKP